MPGGGDTPEEAGGAAHAAAADAPWLEWWSKGPPGWFRAVQWSLGMLFGLGFGVLVVEQWAVWLLVTLNIVSPWTLALGVIIVAVQMLVIFDRRRGARAGCSAPERG